VAVNRIWVSKGSIGILSKSLAFATSSLGGLTWTYLIEGFGRDRQTFAMLEKEETKTLVKSFTCDISQPKPFS